MPATRGTKRKADNETETNKRSESSSESHQSENKATERADTRPLCKYGVKCYQKNAYHLTRFRHPHREESKSETRTSELAESAQETPSTVDKQHVEFKDEVCDSQSEILPADRTQDLDVLPASPTDVKENIKQKYLVEMPEDFFSFWEFQKTLEKENNLDILGIKLVGPFELLDGRRQDERKLTNYLINWRYYFDPPEFQTVAVADVQTGHHLGYFRDSPSQLPAFVGSNKESEGCVIKPYGDNLFSAVRHLIMEKLKKANPFLKSKLTKMKSNIEHWATENGFSLENSGIDRRKKNVVAKTFYLSGIVVPVNKKTKVGYRPIPTSDKDIKKICKKILESEDAAERNKYSDELQQLVTYVQYANDEMDYGMGLELGLDLLAYGGEAFHSTVDHLLSVAYELLERKEFSVILKAHLRNRKRLTEMQS